MAQQLPPSYTAHRPATPATAGWPAGPPTPRRNQAGLVVAAVVVALVGLGALGQVQGWWPWARPTAGPTFSAGPGPATTTFSAPVVTPTPDDAEPGAEPPVGQGTCLTIDAVTLFYDNLRPDNWSSTITDCQFANVQIAAVDAGHDVPVDCDDTTGCWWFFDDGFTYQAYTVPTVGSCFYGFLNTAYPERGSRGANADALHTAVCGEIFPSLDAEAAADTYGLQVSDLAPVEFEIVDLFDEAVDGTGNACPDGASPWRGITYAPGVTMTVCSVISWEPGD